MLSPQQLWHIQLSSCRGALPPQAQQPPYGLDARYAEQALLYFRRAQLAYGPQLDARLWRTLLDCQVPLLFCRAQPHCHLNVLPLFHCASL